MIKGLIPKERLLEWGVGQGWRLLCEFWGKQGPGIPFPSRNTGTETMERVANRAKITRPRVNWNAGSLWFG